jgi:hypothetical protein
VEEGVIPWYVALLSVGMLLLMLGLIAMVMWGPLMIATFLVWLKRRDHVYVRNQGLNLQPEGEVKHKAWWARTKDDAFFYEPPPGFSPLTLSLLLPLKTDGLAVAAEIVYLASLGYVKIQVVDADGKDYELSLVKEIDQKLYAYQRTLLALLFAENNEEIYRLLWTGQNHAEGQSSIYIDVFYGKTDVRQAEKMIDEKIKMGNKTVRISSLPSNFYRNLGWASYLALFKLRDEGYIKETNKTLTAKVCSLIIGGFFYMLSVRGYWLLMVIGVVVIVIMWRNIRLSLTAKGSHYRHLTASFRRHLKLGQIRYEWQEKNVMNDKMLSFAIALGVVGKKDGKVDSFSESFTQVYKHNFRR